MSKIILVEDNEINAKLIRDFLLFKGYEVIIIASGLDVREVVLHEMPKLILMDIQLFGISGIDAAISLKAHEELSNIPIIAVSAFSAEKLEENNITKLFVDYIEKPIDFYKFVEKIEKYMV